MENKDLFSFQVARIEQMDIDWYYEHARKGKYPLAFVREMENGFPEKIIVNVYIH